MPCWERSKIALSLGATERTRTYRLVRLGHDGFSSALNSDAADGAAGGDERKSMEAPYHALAHAKLRSRCLTETTTESRYIYINYRRTSFPSLDAAVPVALVPNSPKLFRTSAMLTHAASTSRAATPTSIPLYAISLAPRRAQQVDGAKVGVGDVSADAV